MKVSIIGSGNVGGLTAMHLAEEGIEDIVLVDIEKEIAFGKSLDLQDCRFLMKKNFKIIGTEDIERIADSDIVIITAGKIRKKGMERTDLLKENTKIIKEISKDIKRLCSQSKVLVVTNPVDVLTYLAIKETDILPSRVMGLGVSLDSARFANLISQELNIPITEIEPCVIGIHGKEMLPLPRFTYIRGISLDEILDDERTEKLVGRTVNRGDEILNFLGYSSYFAPSLALTLIVKAILKDEKRTMGVSCYLNGEYGLSDICLGLPCRIGKEGIEEIIELDLNDEEKNNLLRSADSIQKSINYINNECMI